MDSGERPEDESDTPGESKRPRALSKIARPRAHALARHEPQIGAAVTTPDHQRYPLDELERFLLLRLDGTVGREEVTEELLSMAKDGELEVEGVAVESDEDAMKRALEEACKEAFENLAGAGLLVDAGSSRHLDLG